MDVNSTYPDGSPSVRRSGLSSKIQRIDDDGNVIPRKTDLAPELQPVEEQQETVPQAETPSRKKFGVQELADHSVNSVIGCINNCLYCWSAASSVERGFVQSRNAWRNERVKKALPDFSRKYDGLCMYPTTHDLSMQHIEVHKKAVEEILQAGNQLLICTKPRLEPTWELMDITEKYKNQVTYMITITTLDENKSLLWEPAASLPGERIGILEMLFKNGYRTAVLDEPILDGPGGAVELYNKVEPFVTEHIWFGTMNSIDERVDKSNPAIAEAAGLIKRLCKRENLGALYWLLKNEPKVKFKNSIAKLFAGDTAE